MMIMSETGNRDIGLCLHCLELPVQFLGDNVLYQLSGKKVSGYLLSGRAKREAYYSSILLYVKQRILWLCPYEISPV
jgi:hypothetical protein